MAKKRKNPAGGLCPCGSGLPFEACCGPLLAGDKAAETAEALMRSRYTAYVREDDAYLRDTWAEENRPKGAIADPDNAVKWMGLQVLETATKDDRATVKFVASYRDNGRMQKLKELSRFVLRDGRWYYVDGTFF